jgi:NAD-dependent deacetylase
MTAVLDPQAIETAARLIREARLAVVFSGAGISTPSGIPDFRGGPNSLWTATNPMDSASLTVFMHQPERFFAWLRPLAEKIMGAEPNPAHIALAQLEKAGLIRAVITQNIDQMHQRAGSQHVLELHGTCQHARCIACQKEYPAEAYLPNLIKEGTVPHCTGCGGILKPNIVLFEELLPQQTWAEAEALSQECDVMLVAGSSLEVIPASSLPAMAARNGAQLIIVNRSETHLDSAASLVLNADVVDAIPAIARILL